jgi:hypothetical protein
MTSRSRILAALVLLAIPALLVAASSANAQSPAKKTAATARPLPPIFDPDALGTKSVEAGADVCNKTGRRMFVVLGVNDCKECRVLNDVLHEPAFFADFIKQFVPVLIDVSQGGPNVDFLKNYGVNPKDGLPAVAIFEAGSAEPLITRSGEMVKMAKKGPEAIRTWITSQYKAKAEEAPKQ